MPYDQHVAKIRKDTLVVWFIYRVNARTSPVLAKTIQSIAP